MVERGVVERGGREEWGGEGLWWRGERWGVVERGAGDGKGWRAGETRSPGERKHDKHRRRGLPLFHDCI